jgi:DNA-binding CsgD family transcriptional regulator
VDEHADRAILTLVGELIGVLELDEFAQTLIRALRVAVPSDWVSLNGIGARPEETWAIMVPDVMDRFPAFQRLAHQNPLIARWIRTQDGRAYRFSDVVTQDELHALDLYREVYGPLGVEAQIAFTLPTERDQLLGVALSRVEDYTDAERALLNRARPYLIGLYRNVLEFEALRRAAALGDAVDGFDGSGLTGREAEVLRLIAVGRSNQDAAGALGLSVRTVEKHLERAFRKLGVRSRTEAVAALTRRLPE